MPPLPSRRSMAVTVCFRLAVALFSLSVIALTVANASGSDDEQSSGPHIADVNILLPPKMTQPVEYRLQGTDGCFKWSWDHHDILAVVPEYNQTNHCSTSAQLRSIAPYSGRKETAVFATDVRTGIVIRCKVFIDMFYRIQIFHSSIKLDLDGLATLRVRAFDREENVFSSLVGLQFMWKLIPESNESSQNLLHVPLKDSPLSDCSGFCGDLNVQIKLENNGLYSDLFVVKGVGIGREVVSVHLAEPKFDLMEDKIVLTIAEAMCLEPPSPVFVLIGAVLRYNLKVIQGNIPQVVKLPSQFHRWSVLNSSVAEVNPNMGLAHALSLGETSVIVEDTRVSGHVQMSSLHVVVPDFLSLYLLPVSDTGHPVEEAIAIPSATRWYIVSGRQYLIEVKAFSGEPDVHEIYLTENEELQLNYDQTEHWKNFPVPKSVAVTYGWRIARFLDATSPGIGKLSASLAYFSGHSEIKEILRTVQEVMVCDGVKVQIPQQATSDSSIALPWIPGIYQEAELKAVGGCAKKPSDYKWISSDMATVSVSAAGVVQAKKPGKATIKVISMFDMLNFDEVVVEVSVPSSMIMLQKFPTETVVGSHLQAAVTMKSSSGGYFHRCDAFSSSIGWNTGSESFTIVNSTRATSIVSELEIADLSPAAPCALTKIYAANIGRTILHATLSKDYHRVDNSFVGPIFLKASIAVASYLPLTVHQAGDGSKFGGYWFDSSKTDSHMQLDALYLVPQTHIDVQLVGGPEKWGEDVEFVDLVNVLNEKQTLSTDSALVYKMTGISGNLYRISCQTLGNFTLAFKRGNLVGDDHPLPVVEEVQILLACSFPSSIVVLVDRPANSLDAIKASIQVDREPDHVQSVPVTVANGRSVRISAVGVSNSKKAFANSSSLPISWDLIKCDELAFWNDTYSNKLLKSRWERFLVLQNTSGPCTVRATVQDIQSGSKRVLTDAVRLQLVSTLSVFPSFSLLFFHPEAKMNLSVMGGSCFLDATVNASQVVEVFHPRPDICSQLTLAPRGLGTAVVTVTDMGLTPPLSDTSVVQVADVDWIKILPGEELSIMEGGSQNVNILAGISNGLTFDSSQYIHMNIQVHIKDHIVDLGDDDSLVDAGDGHVKSSNFTLYGRHLGVTTLYVSARQQRGHDIGSKPIKVEVYSPPMLHPHDMFLVPGANYMLSLRGGPTFGVGVEYDSTDDKIAKIDKSSGTVSAISPGTTTVVASIYGSGNIVICQVYGRVRVEVPSSMMLNLQSKQLSVGRKTATYPLLSEGDLFSFYELCKNYQWTIKNETVLAFADANGLTSNHYGSSLSGQKDTLSASYADQYDTNFIRLLHARSAGTTTLVLTFSCHFVSDSYSHSMSYDSSVSLRVVPDLPLALGIPITWVLPPHYNTSDLLPLSSESDIRWDTESQMSSISYSIMGDHESTISIEGSKIRTSEINNLVCIQAKDHTTGIIEVASCLRVAEVAQIRIAKELASNVIDLAVGTELELHLNYYDHLGTPFQEAYDLVLFQAETNYPNIVAVTCNYRGNGSIGIKALHHGRALLRVQMNDDARKSDYILISVGAHMHPQSPLLYPGSSANFSVEGVDGQALGQWFSTDGSVLLVDPLSGKAQAVREGTTKVVYKSSNLTLQTTVTVVKGNVISVDAPKEPLTNAPFPTSKYYFPVKLSDNKLGFPRSNVEVPFDCRVNPPFIGYAKPWRDLGTGDSYCVFYPHSPEHLAHVLPSDQGQAITIYINAALMGSSNITGYASAPFVGGFSILGMDKVLQLNLTQVSNQSIITLVGNTDVNVSWHSKGRLLVSHVNKQDFGAGGYALYEVKVLTPNMKPFKDRITFSLPANGQTLEVDVIYEAGDNAKPASYHVTIWMACIALLMAVLSYWATTKSRSNRADPLQRTVGFTSPNQATPLTPEQRSSPAWDERSPQTPPAFMEYLRRTVDETPYYRRDGRRRSNLQNTY